MILHHHGQMPLARFERDAFRHGPGFQDAINFEAEVVMEASGIVPLHTEIRFGSGLALSLTGRRLGGILETAFSGVLFERHNPFESFYLHHIRLCSIVKPSFIGE
jgi:hypothetical protein